MSMMRRILGGLAARVTALRNSGRIFGRRALLKGKSRRQIFLMCAAPLALVVLIAVSALSGSAQAAAGDAWDMSNFLTSVTITDLYDQPVSTYVLGGDYKFTLSFQENGGARQFQYNDDGVLVYQLPAEIDVINPVTDQPIFAGSTQIGSYSIDANNLVTVRFDDVKEDPTGSGNWVSTPGTNFIDNYVDAFFTLQINAQFTKSGDDINIDFGDQCSVNVKIQESSTLASLAISKEVAYDTKTCKLTYTSTITAADGAVTDIKFRDDASGHYALTDTSFLENVQVSINGGAWTTYPVSATPGTPGTYYWVTTAPNGGFYLCFPDGTTLDDGQSIVVKYTVDYPALKAAMGSNPYSYNDTITNNAYTSGDDSEGKPLDEVSATAVVSAGRSFFKKTGSLDGNTLSWTATVGDGSETLTGKTIYDNLDANQAFNNTAVTIKLFGADGVTQIGGDITVQQTSGTGFTYLVDTPGVYYANVSYALTLADPSVVSTYTNVIGVNVSGKDWGYTAYYYNPNATMGITKSGVLTPDGKSIQWTINWTIPAVYYQKSVFLADHFVYGAQGFQNIPGDLAVTATAGGSTWTLNPDDSVYGWSTLIGGTNSPVDAANQNYWYFYFAPSGAAPAISTYYQPVTTSSLSPFENGAVVTITYTSSLDDLTCTNPSPSNSTTSGETLREALLNPDATAPIGNQVMWSGYLTSWTTGYVWTPISAPLVKTAAPDAAGGYIDYTIKLDVGGNGAHYDLGDDPVFTDTFNSDQLEYVQNSFYTWEYAWNGFPYYGMYNLANQDTLKNYMTDNGDGTTTISIHLKDLMRITGPTGDGTNKNVPAWIGPPTSVVDPGGFQWWKLENRSGTWPIYIFYRLQQKPGAEPGKHEVTNTATINSVWSVDNTSVIGKDVVTKEMELTAAGNIMAATINVNPSGLTLAPDSVNGLYEIKDQMSDSLAAFLSSVVIESETTPGSGDWVTQTIDPHYGAAWSYMTTPDNQMYITVPDATSIRITYNALVKGAVGDNVSVENTVSLLGKYVADVTKAFQLQKTEGSGGGSSTSVTVYKQDASNTETLLPNAVFKLYINEYYPGMSSTEPAFVKDGVDFYYVATQTTNASGQALFSNQYLSYSTHDVYALEEISAPSGYQPPDDPYTFFTLGTVVVPVGFTPTVRSIADYVDITNEQASGPLLPLAGGIGTRPFVVGGSALTALSIATGAGIMVRKRRRALL